MKTMSFDDQLSLPRQAQGLYSGPSVGTSRPTTAERLHGKRSADANGTRAPRGRLELQHIDKNFSDTVPVVKDISLVCEPGEFVVVVGPSGCGKTTLLNIAAGMVKRDAGIVLLDGRGVSAPSPQLAMVFQEHGLFPWLTAAQNIEFGLKMANVPKRDRQERVAAALDLIHLSNSGEKLPHELSGGMKQRVAIARALVMDPAVLLMDEPFAALDAQTRTLLHAQLQDLWIQTHKTILFVTHSVGEAVRLADRIIVLHAHPGRIRREFKIDLAHPRNFDSPDITELAHLVRKEIEEEVNRVNALTAREDQWRPQAPANLDPHPGMLGDGI
jgi:NitT/TauT family transport system ATP-binding protein